MAARRLVLIGLALGVAGVLATGIPTYLYGGGLDAATASTSGPGYCPGSNAFYCIPKLKVDDVVGALKAHGYQCGNERGSYWECQLNLGAAELTAAFYHDQGGITRILSTIGFPLSARGAPVEPGEHSLAFLHWVASLPYADDPRSIEEIRAWITTQVTEKKTVEAMIGGYRYVLNASASGHIELNIEAGGGLSR